MYILTYLVNVLKFRTTFSFRNLSVLKKMWVTMAGIHKMDLKIANREDPVQTFFFRGGQIL